MGYHRAGFDVVGVDIEPQPNYPFDFIQGDALQYLDNCQTLVPRIFKAIHASPPCQAYTPLRALSNRTYPDLVAPTRAALIATGLPWVIENVPGAPLVAPMQLCGGMFGLRTYRHRRFESPVPLVAPAHPAHVIRTATKQRRKRWAEGWHVSVTGDVGTYLGLEAMGIDWMSGNELCQAIPPAYTEYVGLQLMAAVQARAVAA